MSKAEWLCALSVEGWGGLVELDEMQSRLQTDYTRSLDSRGPDDPVFHRSSGEPCSPASRGYMSGAARSPTAVNVLRADGWGPHGRENGLMPLEIGRASCRERVEIWVVAGAGRRRRTELRRVGRAEC